MSARGDEPAFPVGHHGPDSTKGLTVREYAAIHAPAPPEWWVEQQKARPDGLYVEDGIAGVLAFWQRMMADALLAALDPPAPLSAPTERSGRLASRR